METTQLYEMLKKEGGLDKAAADGFLRALSGALGSALKKGESYTIEGIGTFKPGDKNIGVILEPAEELLKKIS